MSSPSKPGCAEGSWRSCLALMLVIYSGQIKVKPLTSPLRTLLRSRSPYQWRPGSNVLKKNNVRLAEVWLDEYKEIYYERINHKLGDPGDLSERKLLRNNLHCKRFQQSRGGGKILENTLVNFSFSWYLENIFPELFVPTEALHQGSLRSAVSSLCLTIPRGKKKDLIHQAVSVQPCKHFPNPRWNIQTWHFSCR